MGTQQAERRWQRDLREHRRRSADAPDVEDWHQFSYDVSEAIAPTWAARRAQIEAIAGPVREWVVRELAPRSGETLLELAAGVGDTGFELARLVGDGGRVISSDFSPAMVEAAGRRGAELGLENIDYRVLDAERIELEDESVDGVACRYGYMLMADPARALAETYRVLRPGGRLALAVWGPPERNPFFAIIATTLVERGHIPPPEPPPAPGIFSMASAERTTSLLEDARFADVRTAEVTVHFAFGDVDEYLAFVGDTAGPIALALRGLPADEREQVKAQLEEAFVHFANGGGYGLEGVSLVAVANKTQSRREER